jgi:DNA-binding transcriptional regulator YdaS (Cro superfamily)
MNKIKLNSEQIIELLGGAKRVAKLCSISIQAVCQWKEKDIPADKLMLLAALLEKESHGLISRKDLFPVAYAWIWPELLDK